jgi:hypothetical protein
MSEHEAVGAKSQPDDIIARWGQRLLGTVAILAFGVNLVVFLWASKQVP